MKFTTVQEAFNHYRTASAAEIEQRAAAIKTEIQTDANADIDSLNLELDGLKEAKTNVDEKKQPETRQAFNPVTSMSFDGAARISDDNIFSSREYRSAFHKTMLHQSLNNEEAAVFQRANVQMATEKRAAFINTGETAAVIPAQMLNEIYKKASDMGGILSLCRRFDIPANLSVPVATPEDSAEWHVEGEEQTPDNKKPTNVIFNGYELMKVFSISRAARSMTVSAYESYLQEELSRVIITALQKASIIGTGAGQPLGLLAPGVITNILADQAKEYITFTKVAAMLKNGYSMGATWAMNNSTLYNGVMAIVDSTGKPIFNEAKDGNADRILGKPIVVDDFIPDNTIVFGNFHYYGMNYPQDILLEVSGDSRFRKGLIDYRAMAVADGKPIVGEAFVKLTLKAPTKQGCDYMIILIEEARDILRLDGDDNDRIIIPLLEVVPDYLEVTTGYKADGENFSPLAVTVARFLLQLWYNADGLDAVKLQRTIDNLLTALSMTVRRRTE